MRIRAFGMIGDEAVDVEWHNGVVTGHPAAVARAVMHEEAGTIVGDPGGTRGPATLDRRGHPELVLATLTRGIERPRWETPARLGRVPDGATP